MSAYVLITPVYNESAYIKKTLSSVVNQTILPRKWIIVDDGSTDNTADIIKSFEEKYSFIKLVSSKSKDSHNFSSKVLAFNFGLSHLKDEIFDFIGNLDGDMGFDNEYYEKILKKFDENPKLGIAGGTRLDYLNGKFLPIIRARNSVAGGFQLFRKDCFNQVGGYKELPYGGIDTVAETTARMLGWEVESFDNILLYHYKPTGSVAQSRHLLKAKFILGKKFYLLGYHPLFVISRYLARIRYNKPFLLGSLLPIIGYLWSSIKRYERPVSKEFVKYLKSEQSSRIREFLRSGSDPQRRQRKIVL